MKSKEKLPQSVEELLGQFNNEILGVISDRIKRIGEMNATQLQSVEKLIKFYGEDLEEIQKRIADLTGKSVEEIERVFVKSAKDAMGDAAVYYEYRNIEQIPYEKNKRLQAIVKKAVENAKKQIVGLSSTTAIGFYINGKYKSFKKAYNELIDRAILNVTTGTTDYNTAIQRILKDVGRGVRVKYKSGATRRIDSAVRMNVLDGMRTMNRDIRKQQGEEFGADGVYIMPHGLCAKDHLPYQGREYTYAEFDRLNARLDRPIATGKLNCQHIAYDVIVGVTTKPYSQKELDELNAYSTETVTYNGKEMTRYEASQKMREAETRIRELKDIQQFYKDSGDELNAKRYGKYVKEARAKYKKRSAEAGLKPQLDRTR